MKKRILRTAAAAAAAVVFFAQTALAACQVSARCAIVMDADSGTVLYEKCADKKSLIASTTKIMTGLLVCENCDLEEVVSVPQEAVGIEGSSMYLKSGESLCMQDLLYGMMLRSGNDAAVALAICCAGSLDSFVEMMNAKAQELGLGNTHFANPNGLDDEENYSTARDLAVLSAYAMKNETFRQTVSTKSIQIGERSLSNHNKLLWQYDGAIGIKTGYTKAAGRILVSAAERDGRRLIAVTIHAPNDWQDHQNMLDEGFSHYQSRNILRAGDVVGRIPVAGGVEDHVSLVVKEDFTCRLLEQEEVRLHLLVPIFAAAPLQGQQAGTVQIFLGETVIAQIPVFYEKSILQKPEKQGFLERIFGG